MNMKNQDSTNWMTNPTTAQDELAEIARLEALANSDLDRERARWDFVDYQLEG